MQAWPASPFAFDASHTLFGALVAAARRHGRRTVVAEDTQPGPYVYGELIKRALALGRLACKVSEPGEHVGVLLPNVMTTVGLIFGVSAFGRVPCMLNYTAGTAGMQSACETAQVRTVLTSRAFLEKAELTATAQAIQGVELIYLEDLRGRFNLLDKLWLMGFALWWPERAVPKNDPEAPAVVLFTSGSEGRPKGVVLPHRAILANVAQVQAVLEFGPEDKVLNALPIYHSFGLTVGTLMPLLLGLRLVLYLSPLHYKVIPQLVRDKGCTVLLGSGTFLQHYARNAGEGDFKTLRYAIAGAEKLAEPVRRLWRERFGIDILEGYGATETAPVLTVNTSVLTVKADPADHAGSVGRFLPGIEARVVPVHGVERGGELHVRGPNLMSGYYRHTRPGVLEPPASSEGEGWYDTGDVVEMDAEGFVHIVGRLKRFAKLGGEMVSLELAEAIARAASPDGLHAAVAIDDGARGEAIVLFSTDADLGREVLVKAARERGYPELALPRRIQFLEHIPLLGSGKVDYVALKNMASQT